MDDERAQSIGELIRGGGRSFSFEFFPPKDEAGEEQLWRAISALEPARPTFVSVTYGAGAEGVVRTYILICSASKISSVARERFSV